MKPNSNDCSLEISSIGEQVIVVQQLNDNEKLRFPATFVNAEETSDTGDGANVFINNVHMPNQMLVPNEIIAIWLLLPVLPIFIR